MLVRGNILLVILLAGAVIAAPVKEIQEDVVNGDELKKRELQSRYGVQPHYPGARQYKEARQYVTDEPTQSPTLSPFYEAPTQTRTGYRGTVYTDEDGRTYVIRRRNGVENKVYTDTPGWDQGGRGYRQRQRNGGTRVRNGNGARVRNGNRVRVRNGNGNRRRWGGGAARPARKKKNNNWSPPTPVKDNDWSPPTPQVEDWSPPTPKPTAWRPDGWRPIPTYQGDYNPSYRNTDEPTELEPTEVPTWDNDGYSGGKCDEPFKSSCCIQSDYYSFDQKQNLCKKLGCDYDDCDTYDLHDDSYDDSDSWGSASEPTDVPTWGSDGHVPTDMPTWETDAWKDEDECKGNARAACCSQTKGDRSVKSDICERLGCDWNKCQTHWEGDTHEPSELPSEEPSITPSESHVPSVSLVPTWSADGWNGDAHEECSKEEQDRCCSQHESKSLEVQSKICKNKFGCSVFKCPQYRKGDDWYGDSFEHLDGDDDDTCDANEQAKCCDQHDGVSITKQQQICKNLWNCSLLKCPKHRQNDDGYDEDICAKDDMISCCSQHPSKPFDLQYSFCNRIGCNLHQCDIAWYKEDEDRCTDKEHYDCCSQSDSISKGTQHENCLKTGCSLFECDDGYDDYDDNEYDNYDDEPADYSNKPKNKWDSAEKPKFQLGYGGDDSTCPDDRKWKCCSPDKSISGSYKAIVKNCQQLGCEWGMCPQNRDTDLYDDQGYYDSYYEYGGGYDSSDQCTDAGKWNCCNPDSSLTGLKAWVRNCQDYNCEWQKCPHHRQGYYDPMEPTLNKSPTSSPVLSCTAKEQTKCCNYQGTLKQAAKYCQELECNISDCNDHGDSYYSIGGDVSFYERQKDDYGGYVDGGDDRPQGNKGPKPGTIDYRIDEGDFDRPQGNKGPRNESYDDDDEDDVDRPQGNKGPRQDGDFLDSGVDENCTREFTAGGACREVCTTQVEYKLMGIVVSTHDETTTRVCS